MERLDFCNVLSKAQIEEMAMSDEYEVVKEVQVRSPFQKPNTIRHLGITD
jgi:hypothetical protein